MSTRRSVLEAQLTVQQRRAAQLIVNNEWAELLNEDGKKRTMQELADEVGIARSTLFEWKGKDEFIAYSIYLTDKQLESMRGEVNIAIVKAIRGGNNGQPSVKALDLYMRRWGLLSNVEIIDDRRDKTDTRRKSDEEVQRDIAELNAMISE